MKQIIPLAALSAVLVAGCSFKPPFVEGWESLGGPGGREVTSVFCDGPSADGIYAGLASGEVYRTSNNGTRWMRLGLVAAEARVYRLVASVEDSRSLFAATSKGLFVSAGDRALWREIILPSLPPHTAIRSLVLDPWKGAVMYAATEGHGILKSTDGGSTWNSSNGGLQGLDTATVFDLTLHIARPNVLFAAVAGQGIMVSGDAGSSWTRLTQEFSSTGSQVTHVLVGGRDGRSIIYATTAGSMSLSINEGASWIPARVAHEGGEILSLAASPDDPSRILAGTERGLIISTNFGSSWTDVPGSLAHVRMSGAFHAGRPEELLAFGESIGFERTTTQGSAWEIMNDGLGGSTVRHFAMTETGDRMYVGLESTIMVWDPLTSSWEPACSGLSGTTIFGLTCASDMPLSAMTSTNLGAFRTTDGGYNWIPLSRSLPVIPKVLELHPSVKSRMIAAGDKGLFISVDQGATWKQAQPVMEHYDVNTICFMPTNAANVYAATSNGLVLLSTNGGYRWDESRYGLNSHDITTITVDKDDRTILYAWTPRGQAYRTTNSGLEWNSYASLWQLSDSALITSDRYNPSRVIAMVNRRALYYSMDGGGTWMHLPDSPLDGDVSATEWNDSTGVFYAGLRHRGVYRLSLKAVIDRVLKE